MGIYTSQFIYEAKKVPKENKDGDDSGYELPEDDNDSEETSSEKSQNTTSTSANNNYELSEDDDETADNTSETDEPKDDETDEPKDDETSNDSSSNYELPEDDENSDLGDGDEDNPSNTANTDDADSENEDPSSTDTADDTMSDTGEANSSNTEDLKNLENEIFDKIYSNNQKKIKENRLISEYKNIYEIITTSIDQIKLISKTEENKKDLEFITDQLYKIQATLFDYITYTYSTKTYTENNTTFYEFLATVQIIKNLIKKVKESKNKINK